MVFEPRRSKVNAQDLKLQSLRSDICVLQVKFFIGQNFKTSKKRLGYLGASKKINQALLDLAWGVDDARF